MNAPLTVDFILALAVSGHIPAVWQPLGSLDQGQKPLEAQSRKQAKMSGSRRGPEHVRCWRQPHMDELSQ